MRVQNSDQLQDLNDLEIGQSEIDNIEHRGDEYVPLTPQIHHHRSQMKFSAY